MCDWPVVSWVACCFPLFHSQIFLMHIKPGFDKLRWGWRICPASGFTIAGNPPTSLTHVPMTNPCFIFDPVILTTSTSFNLLFWIWINLTSIGHYVHMYCLITIIIQKITYASFKFLPFIKCHLLSSPWQRFNVNYSYILIPILIRI